MTFRFLVSAWHKYTQTLVDVAQFQTLERAQVYVADMRLRCRSHESFIITDTETR